MVAEPATRYCTENVQPYLPNVLEEVMVPISLGFTEARQLSESMMDQLCEDFQDRDQREELQQVVPTYLIMYKFIADALTTFLSRCRLCLR